jgi:hypothetical protein
MKPANMPQLFLILICILTYTASTAQDYVVLTKGDTLTGKVKYLNYGTDKKVQITDNNNKKSTYTILQTKGFSLNNDTYQTIRTNSGYSYMKLIKSGYLSLYAYQIDQQNAWDGRYLQKRDGSGVDVPNLGFKKIVARFLSDCEEVVNGLESNELSKSKLDDIIDAYNTCIASRSTVKNNQPVVANGINLEAWTNLEKAVDALPNFDTKETALEIITDIKTKVQRNEKVANFLINGLKESLSRQENLQTALNTALQSLEKRQ